MQCVCASRRALFCGCLFGCVSLCGCVLVFTYSEALVKEKLRQDEHFDSYSIACFLFSSSVFVFFFDCDNLLSRAR